jgi:hypothetical protein
LDIRWILKRYMSYLLLGAAVAAFYPRFIRHPNAMTLYPLAADCLLRGEAIGFCAPAFTYPPAFAFFMIPFAPLPMWSRNLLWYAILVASTFLSFRLSERLVLRSLPGPLQGRQAAWLRILTLLLSLKVVLSVFENQAYQGIVFLSILWGFAGMAERKDLQASAGFGLAAALQATPLLIFPYLLLRRRGKLFLYSLGIYLGASLLPDLLSLAKGATPGYFGTWWHDIAMGSLKSTASSQGMWFEGPGLLNQSLRSLLYRLAVEWGHSAGFFWILDAVYVAYLCLTAGLLLCSARIVKPEVWDGSLLLIGMLMLSPMSSKSHFVVLVLPYMALSACVLREPRMRWLGGSVLAVSFALTTLTSKDLIGRYLANAFLSAGCMTLGALALLVFLAYAVFERREFVSGLSSPTEIGRGGHPPPEFGPVE